MASTTTFDVSPEQGAWAVHHARDVVETTVETGSRPPAPNDPDPVFDVESGAFVTLRRDAALRGCIGRPRPTQPLLEALRSAAVGAATDDPRFPPVEPDELSAITVEVSLLSPPRPLERVDPEGVTVGQDGLIVRRDGQRGLLLPQVAVDQGWDAEAFLRATCRKAGLPEDSWERPATSVDRFRAQVFAETEPAGPVTAEGVTGGD
jgi:AmmeMemoRadiSam system protein A